jgi:hypothetical protein
MNPIKKITGMLEYSTLSEEMRGYLKLIESTYDKQCAQRKAYATTQKGIASLKKASQKYEKKLINQRMAQKGYILAPIYE